MLKGFLFLCQVTVQRDSGLEVTGPKHGKVDPRNAPHVGGNQWAGGTGGALAFFHFGSIKVSFFPESVYSLLVVYRERLYDQLLKCKNDSMR